MTFNALYSPVSERPKTQFFGQVGPLNLIRDQFSLTSWMAFGAMLQGILLLTIGWIALVPVAIYLTVRTVDTWLVYCGVKKNPFMDDVVMGKTSAQMPDSSGSFSDKAAGSQIVVLIVGTRNNHPLGLLAPGYRKMAEYFVKMAENLNDNAEEFGFLAHTSWINASQRDSQNELMNVMYFKTFEGLHKFAHSAYHRDGWSWYNRTAKQYPMQSIFHETFVVPKGAWETIYVNSHRSSFGSAAIKVTDPITGEDRFASPLVDASRGILRTGKGRMDRSLGDDNDHYESNAVDKS